MDYDAGTLRAVTRVTDVVDGNTVFPKQGRFYRRVLLISPQYDTYIVAPHLGLGYLASALRRAGHEVRIIDGLREKVEYDPRDFDLVGVTAMTTNFQQAIGEVRRAKSLGLPVVIGGPHVINEPETSLLQSGADWACATEGDVFIVELASGKPVEGIPGAAYLKDGKAVVNDSRGFVRNVDSFGSPAWDLIDPRTYPMAPHGMIARKWPLAPIITSRGCPFRCAYCSAPKTAGGTLRFRNPVHVVDEIEMLVREYGVREIQIEDDNFTFSREHAVAICNELLRRKVDVVWSLPNGVRIDRLDPELLGLMHRAGCYLTALGIESGNQRILDMVNKRLDKGLVRQTVRSVVDAGIEAWGFFMIGFPTETREEMVNTIEFALSLPLTRLQFTKTTPLPGTPIYDFWKKNYARDRTIDWSSFNYYDFNPEWSEISGAEIAKLQRWGHRRFYGRPRNMFHIVRHMRPRQYPMLLRRLARLKGAKTGTGLENGRA